MEILNLKEHFEGYRNSLKRDAFNEYGEVAKNIPTPNSNYPTLYDAIITIKDSIDKAIDENNLTSYKDYLVRHQTAFIKLFEKIVSNELKTIDGGEDRLLKLIETKGLSWFRFSRGYIAFDKMVYVPRLTAVNSGFKYWGTVLFDADEITLFNETKMSKKRAENLLVKKKESFYKLMVIRPRSFIFRDVNRLNVGTRITDWTGGLFNEDRERF